MGSPHHASLPVPIACATPQAARAWDKAAIGYRGERARMHWQLPTYVVCLWMAGTPAACSVRVSRSLRAGRQLRTHQPPPCGALRQLLGGDHSRVPKLPSQTALPSRPPLPPSPASLPHEGLGTKINIPVSPATQAEWLKEKPVGEAGWARGQRVLASSCRLSGPGLRCL